MTESTLSLTLADLQDAVGREFIGEKPAAGWPSSNPNEAAMIADIIKAGLRHFYGAHDWSFLRPVGRLTTSAAYSTGTISAASGVVTLTSGTFPSWAADGELTPATGTTYTVNTRDGDTQVTLDDTSVAITAGSAYTLTRPIYTLDDDYGDILSPMYFRPGSADLYPPVIVTSYYEIRARRQQSDITSRPKRVCITPKTFAAATGQRWEAMFWPIPDAAYTLFYRYLVNPDHIANTAHYPRGGMHHAEAIKAACLSAGEIEVSGQEGPLTKRYKEVLQQSIQRDARAFSPERLGFDRDRSDLPGEFTDNVLLHDDSWYVTYDGTLPPT